MQYIQARLAQRTITMLGGKVTKSGIRAAIKSNGTLPVVLQIIDSEFYPEHGLATPDMLPGKGIEVRYNDDRDVLMIEVHPSGAAVVL